MTLSLRLFGTFGATQDGEPLTGFRSNKVRALLAFLAVEAGRNHSRDALSTLLWGEQTESSARASLRSALYNLRRVLSPWADDAGDVPFLEIGRHTVTFHADHPLCTVDVAEFEHLVVAYESHLHQDLVHCSACLPRLARIVELYRGDFLAGLPLPDTPVFGEWQLNQQEKYHVHVVRALDALTAQQSALGHYEQAAHYARRHIELVPWQESAYRWLMLSLAMSGQRSAALVQYETCCRLLQQELSAEPDTQTTVLYRRIRDGAVGWEAELDGEPENPYKGLLPFREEDAQDFFGREKLVGRLLDRLSEKPGEEEWLSCFLVVVGPSGSGKSSLVRAGLIPALRRSAQWNHDGWTIATMFPGPHPVARLQAVLNAVLPPSRDRPGRGIMAAGYEGPSQPQADRRSNGARVLMVVDQAEELFTLTRDEDVRMRFMSDLQSAVQLQGCRVHVVMTLRADYYAYPLRSPVWARVFTERTEYTLPLSPEELRRAIEAPASRVGVRLQPDLLSTLLVDVGREPGALPLLQYVLTELFERREGRVMTLAAYQSLGGLTGALVGRVNELYSGLRDLEQVASRQLFMRLVRWSEEATTARRRVPCDEVFSLAERPWRRGAFSAKAQRQALETVMELFGRHRLLTLDQDPITGAATVEVAHEALITSWDRLRGWIRSGREDLRMGQRFRDLVQAWEQSGRHSSFLLRGRQLEQFEAWAATTNLVSTSLEVGYLESSMAEREARGAEEAARRDRELTLEERAHQRLRTLRILQVSAVVVALVLSLLVAYQQRIARRNAAVASSLNLATSARLALADDDTDLALALAVEANSIPDPPLQAQTVLADAVYAPGTRRILVGHNGPVEDFAVAPTMAAAADGAGHLALSASADETLILWDLEGGQMLRRLTGHTDAVNAVAFLPEGHQALSGSEDGTLILWDVATGAALRRFDGHAGGVRDVAVSADGRTAISGAADQMLILWNVETGDIIRRIRGHEDAILSVAISPDGSAALSGSADGSLILWDLETGEIRHQMSRPDGAVQGSPQAVGHSGSVRAVAFLPQPLDTAGGAGALSVSEDAHAILWDLDTGQLIRSFDVGTGVVSLSVGPDGRSALLGTIDGRLILLDLDTGDHSVQYRGHTGPVLAVNFVTSSPFEVDARSALSGSADGTLRSWDLWNGGEMRSLTYLGSTDMGATDVAISPDGKLLLTALSTGEISLRDYATGSEVRRLSGHTAPASGGVHFLPGTMGRPGLCVVSGAGGASGEAQDNTVRLWDAETGQELLRFVGHTDKVLDTDVSADGRFVASAASDGTLRLWDTRSGEGKILLDVFPQAVQSVAFSPDAESLVVGLADGQSSNPDHSLRLLDREMGREILRLTGHTAAVTDVAFSPDGTKILSGSSDTNIILWDANSGTAIGSLSTHATGVTAVAFHPGGRLAASGAVDGSILIWDLPRGMVQRHYIGANKPVLAMTFVPGGHSLLVATVNDAVHEWRVEANHDGLLDWLAANREYPGLTCRQREMYSVEPLCEAGAR